ncbi:hypothetical protein C8F04DRAFT_506465 [Mycena alexandri]|uniref:CxC5 like cysteine cluster associated with KDZ domain-containing protein n=1 Tax=Mycena alexandri TaxID=1745969 RepID=A0AAD6WLC2_9AGAR|nr:hypothetical protein C8F04DRAFT_506465 [Mycena alexandri]
MLPLYSRTNLQNLRLTMGSDCMAITLGLNRLVPPVTKCPRSGCDHKLLGEAVAVEARLYTLHRGVLPVFSKSLYCRSCSTRYYHNYFVKDASQASARREYYDSSVPQIIHVTETSFFESQLCVYFETQMAMTHSSAEGISRIYNLALGQSSIPNASRLSHLLDGDLVLDAFFHHAVLRDKSFRHQTLSLPHTGAQRNRLDEVLQERNYHMVGTGQEFWAHTCNRCMKVYKGEDGNWYQPECWSS